MIVCVFQESLACCSSKQVCASSAAGRGGDGTVEEGELPSWLVYRDGDWEIEDCAAVADGWTCRLWGAGGRGQDLRLKLEELTHEAEVWGDDAAALLDKLKGLVQLHTVGPHEICKANGGRAGDACLTVHKHTSSFIPYRVWREEREEKATLVHCKHPSGEEIHLQRMEVKLWLSQEGKNTKVFATLSVAF